MLGDLTQDQSAAASDPTASFACPHCGEKTFAREDVLRMGPALSYACPACDGRVSVTWASNFRGALPALLGLLVGMVIALAITFGAEIRSKLLMIVLPTLAGVLAHKHFPVAERELRTK